MYQKSKEYQFQRVLNIDILCSNNTLHVLGCDGSTEVWDFNGSCPVKMMDIRLSLEPSSYFSRGLDFTHLYLVESHGDVLLVVTGEVRWEIC